MIQYANDIVESEMNPMYIKSVIDRAKAGNKELVETHNYEKYSPEVVNLEALVGRDFLTSV